MQPERLKNQEVNAMRKFKPVIVPPARERGKIAPTQLAHVVLMTPRERFEAMVEWYEIVLEAEIAYANDDIAFMAYDEEHHRIAIGVMPGGEPAPPAYPAARSRCSSWYW